MPLINYSCSCGKVYKKYFNSAKDALSSVDCECGAKAVKSFGATTVGHKIVIDNGLMSKSIEISPDIMEINEERSKIDYTEED